ncbi:MAG: hypothetical protein M1835_005095 [Candelina submexicana]|nr:MAG: hypothetical protein M1835_005095 [Candelina submexicana]
MAEEGSAKRGWTDAEKLALCIAVINQIGTGAPRWATLPLPAGRTAKAAQHCWSALKKEADGIQTTDGSNPVTPKKRAPSKVKAATDGTPTPKRKRATKATTITTAKNEDDDEENDAKKVKITDEEEEIKIKAEIDGEGEFDDENEQEVV